MARAKVAMYDTRRVLVSTHLPDAVAGTAANYGVIFICPADTRYKLVGVEEIHTVKAAANATLTLEKLTPAQAPNAGVEMLAAALPLDSTAEIPQYGSIAGVIDATRTLAVGDRICLKDAGGAIAAVRNCQVTIELEELATLRAKEAPTEKEQIFAAAVLYGAQPQTAGMYDKFFTASRPCRVIAARAVFTTGSGDALGFCQIEKLNGTDAPGTGDNLLTNNANAGFDLNAANDTVQAGTLTAVAADLVLARGDRLALDPVDAHIGTTAGLCVTVELEAID